jgi:alkylation response protein AidB-like acyl-CoA dehydrogenase
VGTTATALQSVSGNLTDEGAVQLLPPLDARAIVANAHVIGPEIEKSADAIANARRLPDDVVSLMRRAGIFRIAFPKAWGGPEMDILRQCRVMESLGYHDASAAWVAMIGSDSGHYATRIDEEDGRALYPDLDLLTAGALSPSGQAHSVTGGFTVTGRWSFGSGCLHADRMVGGCLVFQDGKPVLTSSGAQEIRVVWLPMDQVQIHDTWHTTGLAGSGSNDYSVQNVFVPRQHSFRPTRCGERPEPLYRYSGFFFANLPAVAFGCARRMVDDFKDFASRKLLPPDMQPLKNEYRAQIALAEATARLRAAKSYQDKSLRSLWETLIEGEKPSTTERADIGLMGVYGMQEAVRVSEIVCEAAGSAALYTTSPFERRRRDLITMSTHIVGQRKTFEPMGRLLFGLDA